MNRVRMVWVAIRSSLWFVPALLVTSAIVAAVALVEIDKVYAFDWSEAYPLLFGAGAEGSRGMLSTIAGSMITVAGLTFSLTISALATASGQYTSRILRNFMRDPHNQFVLGAFVSIFAYCLVVLRAIRSGDEGAFVPSLAVFAGLLLAIGGIWVLVFFIHHIATSIQATTIIENITAETIASAQRALPETVEGTPSPAEADAARERADRERGRPAMAQSRGYVQAMDMKRLLELAQKYDAIVRLDVRPGDFVMEGGRLLRAVSSSTQRVDPSALADTIAIHGFRTIDQEFGFGIRQLVDVALKALSPGVNDTTTAVMCIDHLAAVLSRIAERPIPDCYRAPDGCIRVFIPGWSFRGILDAAFDQIRDNAGGNFMVLRQLFRALEVMAPHAADGERRDILRDHVRLVDEVAATTVPLEHNRSRLRLAAREALSALSEAAASAPTPAVAP